MELTETDNAVVTAISEDITREARRHRWSAWAVESNINEVLDAVRSFVDLTVRERVEGGLGDFVGELRNALPMFVQLRTPDDPQADPRLALDRYVQAVQDVLADSGGRLMSVEVSDKGSVLFAVFGAPVAYGDDAERALRVALTLRDSAALKAIVVSQCIGVSRGILYAGTVGGEVRHEYSTIGDETNIAARLMTAAEAGQVLVSSAVRKEAGGRVLFHELPPVTVKGRVEPIPIFEPVAIRAAQPAPTGKLVGREAELNRLTRLLKAVRLGHGRIVRLEGEAGIGKSRLVAELTAIAAGQGFRVAGGDCISTGRNIAYLPWQQVLTMLFDLNPEAGASVNIAVLSDYVNNLVPGSLPRLPLLGDVLQLPTPDTPTTAKLEGRTRRQANFALVNELILSIAHRQPLILVIDDVQWLDEISEALTVDLIRRLDVEPAPLMLVLVHRPVTESDHVDELIGALGGMHLHHHFVLSELSRADVDRMIDQYLGGRASPPLADFVYERAQGNPFFVQEVIDTLLETDFVKVGGSFAIVIRDLAQADLPQTVQGLIQARIDRLGELDKLVLKVAAIIGREFQVRVLEGSLPVPMAHDELLECLHTLEKRDFSYLALAEPDPTYRFKHAITQEVAYQSLLSSQRQQLHHTVAMALKALAPDSIGQLAYHFSLSGDTEQARRYLILAGQRAFREYANQSALDYFSQALKLTEDATEAFEINSQRMRILLRQGDTRSVQAQLPALQTAAEESGRVDWQALVHIFWADYYTQTSAWPEAMRDAQQAATLAESEDQDTLAWESYLLLRGAMLSLNQRSEVVRSNLDQKMQTIAERMGDPQHVIEQLLTWFDDLYAEGPDIAIQGAQTALARAEELQAPVLEAECWSVLGELYRREGNLPAALESARQQIALLRQIGDRRREGLTLNRIGYLLVNLGLINEGNAHLIDAYQILHQIGERSGEAANLISLGIVAEFYGAHVEALSYMGRALAMQRALKAEVEAALTLFYMANVYITRGVLDEAEQALTESRAIIEANYRLPYILPLIEIDTARAEIEMQRGQLEPARRRLVPMLLRLQRRQINGLYRPGLAYWRTIQVLEKNQESQQAAQLRLAFRTVIQPTLDWLVKQNHEQDYVRRIWYHAALLEEQH